MKKFFTAIILASAATLAHAGVYETRTDFYNGNYELTIHNDTPFFIRCRVDSTLGGWYNFTIAPWGTSNLYFTGPSKYKWGCWR